MTARRSDGLRVGLFVLTVLCVPVLHLSAQDSFPSRPPVAEKLHPVRFPPFQQVALPNGMTLLLVENHEQPTLALSLSFRAGSIYDPAGKEGVADFVADLLTKGTPTRDAEQIASTIEGAGGSIGASAGGDFLTVSTDGLSDHADLAFTLLGDVTRRATYPREELELTRTRSLSSLDVELSQAGNVAARAFQKELFGRNPYGRSTSAASYKAITRDDVVGIAPQVLGGGPDSRLFAILREQKSWTYGSYAGLRRNRGLGYWQATFEGRTEVTDSALVELLHQIDRVRTETIPDSELNAAKGFLVGSFPLTIETPSQIAQVVSTARLLGLGSNYVQTYRDRLSAVTPTRARSAAQRTIRRDNLTIVV